MQPISIIPSAIVTLIGIFFALRQINIVIKNAGNNFIDSLLIFVSFIALSLYSVFSYSYVYNNLYLIVVPMIFFFIGTIIALVIYNSQKKVTYEKMVNPPSEMIAFFLSLVAIVSGGINIYNAL